MHCLVITSSLLCFLIQQIIPIHTQGQKLCINIISSKISIITLEDTAIIGTSAENGMHLSRVVKRIHKYISVFHSRFKIDNNTILYYSVVNIHHHPNNFSIIVLPKCAHKHETNSNT